MKVFISHKQEDAARATQISNYLRGLLVDSYLDVLDNKTSGDGKELTEHIKSALNQCSDILVVMSEKTKWSQWVPFEIGMSAQANMATVTFLDADVALPEFLSYWPRLKRLEELSIYIKTRNATRTDMERRYGEKYIFSSDARYEEVREFYSKLKTYLR